MKVIVRTKRKVQKIKNDSGNGKKNRYGLENKYSKTSLNLQSVTILKMTEANQKMENCCRT